MSANVARRGTGAATICAACIVVAGIAARALLLGVPAHDYDEGVYWQSLLAMDSGYALYRDIFYSQPPMFLELTFGFFIMFGKTLAAARVAMLLSSAVTITALALIGKRLAGNTGAFIALTLIAINLSDIKQATTLQAEAPAIAFSTLSVALVLIWYESRTVRSMLLLAALAGATAVAGILCKLLVAPCLLMFLALVAHKRDWRAMAAWAAGGGVLAAIALIPFAGRIHELYAQIIAFHAPAGDVFAAEESQKWRSITLAFATPLGALAVFGVVRTLVQRNLRGGALLLWLCGTILTLGRITPLWGDHHFSALQPPLIALSALGLSWVLETRTRALVLPAATLFGLCFLWEAYGAASLMRNPEPDPSVDWAIVTDLQHYIPAHSWIITDGQGDAAAAGLETPPFLVDTSHVRIRTGYLTSAQIIQQARTSGSLRCYLRPNVFVDRSWQLFALGCIGILA